MVEKKSWIPQGMMELNTAYIFHIHSLQMILWHKWDLWIHDQQENSDYFQCGYDGLLEFTVNSEVGNVLAKGHISPPTCLCCVTGGKLRPCRGPRVKAVFLITWSLFKLTFIIVWPRELQWAQGHCPRAQGHCPNAHTYGSVLRSDQNKATLWVAAGWWLQWL